MTPDLPDRTDTETPPRRRREQARQVAFLVLAALVVIFAVLNLDEVKVDWIVGSRHTPLIVVIVVSILVGVAGDRIAQRRHAKDR